MKKFLAGLALAALAMLAAPQQAGALSLLSPAGATTAKYVSDSMVTEVRWGRRGFGRGHVRGFRGWRGHRGWRVHRAWRPRHFAPRYHVGPIRRCRVVWTYYGPQRICRYRYF